MIGYDDVNSYTDDKHLTQDDCSFNNSSNDDAQKISPKIDYIDIKSPGETSEQYSENK